MTQSTEKGAEFVDFPELDNESGKTNTPAPAETSFEDKVNAAVSEMTQEEDGTWKLPEGLSEEVQFAANLEKRRRDTQSAFGKSQNQLKSAEKERDSLRQHVLKDAHKNLTTDQKLELEELRGTDPDKYLEKKEEYEQSAVKTVEQELSELSEDPAEQEEIARRGELLQKALDDNPGLVLNDDVFTNDLPPRLTKQLEDGSISFDEFLDKAVEFLKPSTVIKDTDDDEDEEVNLGDLGGGSTADDQAVKEDAVTSYNEEVY